MSYDSPQPEPSMPPKEISALIRWLDRQPQANEVSALIAAFHAARAQNWIDEEDLRTCARWTYEGARVSAALLLFRPFPGLVVDLTQLWPAGRSTTVAVGAASTWHPSTPEFPIRTTGSTLALAIASCALQYRQLYETAVTHSH